MGQTRTKKAISPKDKIAEKVQLHFDSLTKPQGSLGYLEDAIIKLGVIQNTDKPKTEKKRIIVFAADHGIAAENVSAYPPSVTPQMVLNFAHGGAAINVLAKKYGIDLQVVDVGVNGDFKSELPVLHKKIRRGTRNFLHEDAMTEAELEQALDTGRLLAVQAKKVGINLLGVGDMGIGNTSAASAITASLLQVPIAEVTGRGTGLSNTQLQHKIQILRKALRNRRISPTKPKEILRKVGGYEIAAIAGVALGCAEEGLALVIDGFIATAGVAVAAAIDKRVRQVIFGSHKSQERGHMYLLDYLKIRAFLTLEMRLGEGTGATIAMDVLDAGVCLYNKMATFASAGVDNKS